MPAQGCLAHDGGTLKDVSVVNSVNDEGAGHTRTFVAKSPELEFCVDTTWREVVALYGTQHNARKVILGDEYRGADPRERHFECRKIDALAADARNRIPRSRLSASREKS
jgi:hypothetical protein